jgi:hypothetical protein
VLISLTIGCFSCPSLASPPSLRSFGHSLNAEIDPDKRKIKIIELLKDIVDLLLSGLF